MEGYEGKKNTHIETHFWNSTQDGIPKQIGADFLVIPKNFEPCPVCL